MTLVTPTTETPTSGQVASLQRQVADLIDALEPTEALYAINQSRSVLTAAETRVLSRQISSGVGAHQLRQTIKDTTGDSNRDTAQAVRRAEALHGLPDVVEGLASGELSTGQVDLITKAANETSADAVAADSNLVERIKQATVDQGRRVVKDWIIDQQDPDQLRNRHERMHARREAGFFTDSSGMIGFKGLFPPLVGRELRAAVTRESRRLYESEGGRDVDGNQHQTSQPQRTADALANLILGRAKGGSTPGRRRSSLRSSLTEFVRWRSQTSRCFLRERGAGLEGAPPAELLGSGPLPNEVVEQLAERSDVLGMVFSGNGQPLWLGRKKRLATNAQFVAAMVRDGGCVSCGETHDEMTVHHTIPFSAPAEGRTDIDNLAMLGVGCHTQVHATHQRLVWNPKDKQWGTLLARPEERARPREGPRPPGTG